MSMTELQAGRALDALVAEKILGRTDWEHGEIGETSGGNPYCVRCNELGNWGDKIFTNDRCCPRYSKDIAAAWLVIEKLEQDGFQISLNNFTPYWHVVMTKNMGVDGFGCGQADTAPLAICLAALKAVGYQP